MRFGREMIVLLLSLVTSAIAVDVVKENILVEKQLTWPDAQSYCRTHHKDLVSIHSKEEVKTLLEKYGDVSKNYLWIGMEKNASKNQWLWSCGEPVNFTFWLGGQPDNFDKIEDCGVLQPSSEWNDAPCNMLAYYMCFSGSRSSGDLRYHFIKEKKTWFEARDTCRENYTDLVSITSQQEQDNIKNLVGGDYVWIGLYQNPWQWSNGDEASFQNWDEVEPNDKSDEACVVMYLRRDSNSGEAGRWIDFGYTAIQTYFLCYEEKLNLTLVKETKTWREAFIYCRTNHTDLVSITGPEIQKQVAEVVNASTENRVWIRLHRERFSGYWFWMNEELLEYSNWGSGIQGDPLTDHCGFMDKGRNFTWGNTCCQALFSFVCVN
uniref:C-type lectin domain-containing protein n=1 Tax=Latimeria chalumnae TaxID=7897 RepID=H2ZTL4_LATCH